MKKDQHEKENESKQEKIANKAIKIENFSTYNQTQLRSFTLFE